MTTTYRTFRNLTAISVLGVIGSLGYGYSEFNDVLRTSSSEFERVVEIDAELRDISSVLDSIPVRVVFEDSNFIQRYVAMHQKEDRLKKESDSLSAFPAVQQVQKERGEHLFNTMFYGIGGFCLFGLLGAVSAAEWTRRSSREKR